jgi:hypothetical protein
MKSIVFILLSLFVALSCSVNKQMRLTKSELPHLIDSLHHADQSCANIQPPDSAAAAFQRVIRSNFPWVASIFRQYGFPGYDLVGKETSDQYFLLVQHSDFDGEFQKAVLKNMEKQVKKRNASGRYFAYLIDRTEINSGRSQVYGTQVFMSANTRPMPCIDSLNLDKRRAAIGLESIREYLDKCNEVFYQLNPNERKPDGKGN